MLLVFLKQRTRKKSKAVLSESSIFPTWSQGFLVKFLSHTPISLEIPVHEHIWYFLKKVSLADLPFCHFLVYVNFKCFLFAAKQLPFSSVVSHDYSYVRESVKVCDCTDDGALNTNLFLNRSQNNIICLFHLKMLPITWHSRLVTCLMRALMLMWLCSCLETRARLRRSCCVRNLAKPWKGLIVDVPTGLLFRPWMWEKWVKDVFSWKSVFFSFFVFINRYQWNGRIVNRL